MTPGGPEYRYVEKPSMELLASLGWHVIDAFQETLGADGTLGRDSQRDVILSHRLRAAILRLNDPEIADLNIPPRIVDEAIAAVARDRSIMHPVRANHEVYELLRDGYRAEWQDERGRQQYSTIRYLDLANPRANDLLAVQQLWVKGPLHSRRLDVVLFVNGVPLALMEFKEPSAPSRRRTTRISLTIGTRSRTCSRRTCSCCCPMAVRRRWGRRMPRGSFSATGG